MEDYEIGRHSLLSSVELRRCITDGFQRTVLEKALKTAVLLATPFSILTPPFLVTQRSQLVLGFKHCLIQPPAESISAWPGSLLCVLEDTQEEGFCVGIVLHVSGVKIDD